MKNLRLAADYVRRAEIRMEALDVFFEAESWADVVRDSQEIVELATAPSSAILAAASSPRCRPRRARPCRRSRSRALRHLVEALEKVLDDR